jgi:hypothetical protein
MKVAATFAGLAACLVVAGGAQAAVFTVDALAHSSNGGAGTGLATVSLTAGEIFSVSADAGDLWSAGALPRWSNANGLTGDLFATGTDESGQAAGTLIGSNFGLLDINGFSAPFGALVGQIGTGPGSYRLLGTGFSGAAWDTGTLVLYYWDTFTADNSNSVDVDIGVGVVPEPAAWAMMIAGFGLAGATLRRRRAAVA